MTRRCDTNCYHLGPKGVGGLVPKSGRFPPEDACRTEKRPPGSYESCIRLPCRCYPRSSSAQKEQDRCRRPSTSRVCARCSHLDTQQHMREAASRTKRLQKKDQPPLAEGLPEARPAKKLRAHALGTDLRAATSSAPPPPKKKKEKQTGKQLIPRSECSWSIHERP